MKTLIKTIFFILFLATVSSSCVNVKNKKEIKEIPVSIIVTDKLGLVAGDKLPLEIDSLFAPIEPSDCPKVAYLPKIEIVRYGFPNVYHQVINTEGSGWKTFFQKFYGNTGVETRKSNIAKALDKYAIGDSLILANPKNFNLSETIEKVIQSNPATQFYVYASELNTSTYKIGNKEIVAFNNVKALLSDLGKQLCEKPGKANQKISIFYNPKLAVYTDSIKIDLQDTVKTNNINKPVNKVPEKPVNPVKPNNSNANTTSLGGSASTPSQGKTLTMSNGDKYVGEVKNNKPNGWGTMTFAVSRLISDDDPKKTMAEKGDFFTGVWLDGKPQSGKLFDSGNILKSTLIFGVAK